MDLNDVLEEAVYASFLEVRRYGHTRGFTHEGCYREELQGGATQPDSSKLTVSGITQLAIVICNIDASHF